MNQLTKTHVIFGTGPVGLAVMEELIGQGKDVKMINRSGHANVPEQVEVIGTDASDIKNTRDICKGASVVYNCTNVDYHRWTDLLPELHTAILEGAAYAEVPLVVMENLYMYGSSGGKPMTEETPYQAETRKGRVRTQMTVELFEAHRAGKVKAVSGRASDFFGPFVHLSMLGDQIIRPALEGKPANLLGNPDLPHTYTYISDIGKALVILGENEKAFGKPWHIPSPATVTTRQVVEILYRLTGHPVKFRAAPRMMVSILGLFNKQMRELKEMMYEFEEPFIMDDSSFRDTFGMEATPLEQALQEAIRWFRSTPKSA
ncbi:MAG: NAD-dependent epimerase/dehydratase family protein [Calditrichaeota bacterium]|nr:NAD-dependent epimerase/dehydratase family protein [Calditrichota bacterium]